MALRVSAVGSRDIQTEIVVDVAGRAGWHLSAVGDQRMRIRQRETKRAVIELAIGPLGDRVARRAGRGG